MSLGKFLMILQNKDYQPAYHLFVQYCKERPERSQDLEYLYEQVIVVLCLFMLKKTLWHKPALVSGLSLNFSFFEIGNQPKCHGRVALRRGIKIRRFECAFVAAEDSSWKIQVAKWTSCKVEKGGQMWVTRGIMGLESKTFFISVWEQGQVGQ